MRRVGRASRGSADARAREAEQQEAAHDVAPAVAPGAVYTAEQWQLASTWLSPAVDGQAEVAALLRRVPGGSSMQTAMVVYPVP